MVTNNPKIDIFPFQMTCDLGTLKVAYPHLQGIDRVIPGLTHLFRGFWKTLHGVSDGLSDQQVSGIIGALLASGVSERGQQELKEVIQSGGSQHVSFEAVEEARFAINEVVLPWIQILKQIQQDASPAIPIPQHEAVWQGD